MADEDVDSDGEGLYIGLLVCTRDTDLGCLSDEVSFGPQSPPLTDQIASVLRRYPDGGQILKVK